MKQTYTWNKTGLLIATEEQQPLLTQDRLLDTEDLMSGILEESDLAHYKPKCDIIVQGHAYPPKTAHGRTHFQANLQLQVPNSTILTTPQHPTKYPHINPNKKPTQLNSKEQLVQGKVLINKTLNIYSPRQAINNHDNITGKPRYHLNNSTFSIDYTTQKNIDKQKVSLSAQNSFGGYCLLEENNPKLTNLNKLDKEAIIPPNNRNIKINPQHQTIAYMAEDEHNPYGTGYLPPLYHQAVQPKRIKLPQIMPTNINDSQLIDSINQMVNKPLEADRHKQMVAGFGIRNKSHPDRQKYYGTIDKPFIDSDKLLPNGFDFAVWNCAYPDQQTEYLKGNEWITLTNLCKKDTIASYQTAKGDTQLRLYLPECVPCLAISSDNPRLVDIDIPMRLDTVIIAPDIQQVSLVWRAMIIGDYKPKDISVSVLEQAKQDELVEQYFTRVARVDRPYQEKRK